MPEEQEQTKPEDRNYLKPVAWLGGRDLLANLKYFLLFAAFKGKLDPRDWMRAEVFPPNDPTESDKAYIDAFNNSFRNTPVDGEFWFDYFADSGDGMTAGYALAYLCMTDVHARVNPGWETLSPVEREQHIAAGEIRSRLAAGQKPSNIARDFEGRVSREILTLLKQKKSSAEIIAVIESTTAGILSVAKPGEQPPTDYINLPRGAFLFVGGDTAYHVSDFAGLGLRFQKVFDWAYEDLKTHLTADEVKQMRLEENRRPLFAVPGNHDYYDMIDGFNRQFCRPVTGETRFINLAGRNLFPQLRTWPFKRAQTASYVAIKLPFGWWFWGVDSELRRVDLRQQEYFKRSYYSALSDPAKKALREEIIKVMTEEFGRAPTEEEIDMRVPRLFQSELGNRWAMPTKLIVATSEPTTVEGRRARDDEDTQDKTPQAFCFLDLTRPFIYPGGPRDFDCDFRKGEERLKLVDFRCRLDISGDVHHYARYWGDGKAVGDYASLVAGGGGASMSPTQTDYDEVEEQVIYPGKEVSTRAINKQLFKPWVVISGGNVWMAGLVIAMLVYVGASLGNHREFTSAVLFGLGQFLSKFLPFVDVPEPSTSFSSYMGGFGRVVKFLALLVASGVAVSFAGLYARWLFERMTKTYDWAMNKRENLRLGKQKRSRAESDVFDQRFKVFSELLDKIRAQKNAGVNPSALFRFWGISLLGPISAGLLWILEFSSWAPSSGLFYCALFSIWFVFTIAICWLTYSFSKKRFADFRRTTELHEKAPSKIDPLEGDKHDVAAVNAVAQFTVTPSHDYVPFWSLLLFPGIAVFWIMAREYRFAQQAGEITPFGTSALILFSLIVAGAAGIVAIYYSKWLFDQAYRVKVNLYSYGPVMALSGGAIVVLGISLWRFLIAPGRNIILDILYLIALIGVPAGCVALAVGVGNHVSTLRRNAGFLAGGLWHGILQLLYPILLVWVGGGKAFGIALISAVVFTSASVFAIKLFRVNVLINRRVLSILWFVYGLWMLLIPIIWAAKPPERPEEVAIMSGLVVILGSALLAGVIGGALADFSSWKRGLGTIAGAALVGGLAGWIAHVWFSPRGGTCVLAGLLGAVMSCVWLGWYFAVALVFDGHANEAGSTARTEDYKHFIRFRVTKDTLTGFVIGIDFPHAPKEGDEVRRDGATLKPRLVDVFTLKCNSTPATPWEAIEENTLTEPSPVR